MLIFYLIFVFSKTNVAFAGLVADCVDFQKSSSDAFMISSDVGMSAHQLLRAFRSSSSRRTFVTRVLNALHKLHLLGFIHGDARLPNLVELHQSHNSVLKWIDYSRMKESGDIDLRCRDWKQLTTSIFHCLNVSPNPSIVEVAVDADDYTNFHITELAELIIEHCRSEKSANRH